MLCLRIHTYFWINCSNYIWERLRATFLLGPFSLIHRFLALQIEDNKALALFYRFRSSNRVKIVNLFTDEMPRRYSPIGTFLNMMIKDYGNLTTFVHIRNILLYLISNVPYKNHICIYIRCSIAAGNRIQDNILTNQLIRKSYGAHFTHIIIGDAMKNFTSSELFTIDNHRYITVE